MKDYQTFTEFLCAQHRLTHKIRPEELSAHFDKWLQALSVDELIDYADRHTKNTSKIAMDNAFERFQHLQAEGK